MSGLSFNQTFSPQYGTGVNLTDSIVRITADNPGPFTFHGTNSYLIGKDDLALIDPGPSSPTHLDVILKTIGDRQLRHIFVSHTHKDHSSLTYQLKERTGAIIYAQGPHRAARELQVGEINALEDSADMDFSPDVLLTDGQIINGGDWSIEAVHTPGHTANHCAFYYREADTFFSADHVMAWSTSIVAPPDGSMRDYLQSLDKLIARDHRHILPGHGPDIIEPGRFLPALKAHRLGREADILRLVRANPDIAIPDLVHQLYQGLSPNLAGAAALSVFAHLEDLAKSDRVTCDGPLSLNGRYRVS